MNDRTPYNLSSIGFAAVVLLSVLIGGINKEKQTGTLQQQDIEGTSVTANATGSFGERPSLKTNLYVAEVPSVPTAVAASNEKPATPKPTSVPTPPTVALATLPAYQTNQTPVLVASIGYAVNLANREVLLNFNGAQRWAMASLTKLMTAVVAKEEMGYNKQIVLSQAAMTVEGNNWGFRSGELVTSADLIHAMLIVSHNQAAAALAEAYGEKEFIHEMQQKANDLGMTNTTFFDSVGLSSLNQSSAADIEKLMRYIITNHQDLLAFTRQKEMMVAGKTLTNINIFAGQPDFIGGKTGYTDEANGNLVSLFNYRNQPLLIVVMGADNRFAETQKIYQWVQQQ